MPTYFDQSLSQLQIFEGSIPWMYLDTRSNVTVGVGLMLANSAAAAALEFVDIAGDAADPDDIVSEFERVTALAPGMRPAFYKTGTSPELTHEVITDKLAAVLGGFEATLREGIAGYDALPDPAKMALLDMAYNLGPHGLLKGYPTMLRAVAAANWAAAANQCARGGIGPARNTWTRLQFLSAADAAAAPPAES